MAAGIALRIQGVVLRKALLKLAPYFGSVFLQTASFEPEWRVLGYELIPSIIPDGKHDVSSSGNQVFGITERRNIVEPIKVVSIYDRARQPRNQAP